MPEANKVYGKALPEEIDLPERVCFVIDIPDTPQYRAALMGQLEWLADWRCWQHTQEDYPDPPPDNVEAAELFAIAVTDGRFDECGVMTCEDVTDCIENDDGTRGAIETIVRENTTDGSKYPYGQELSETTRGYDMAGAYNPTCDQDILFAQCSAVIDFTDAAIRLALAQVEGVTNPVELVNGLIDVIPLVSTVKQTLGVSGVLDTINYFQEVVGEEYNAQYSTLPEGTRDQLRCALLCACKLDCAITIDRIIEVMTTRLSVYIAPPSFDGFSNLISVLGGFNIDTTFVVDAAFWGAWQLAATGNFLFGNPFDDTLEVVLALAVNDPDGDWETLCDCVAPTTYQIYATLPNFGGTLLDTQPFVSGVLFVVESIDLGGGQWGVAIEADGVFEMQYGINPDPVAPTGTGILAWLYNDEFDTVQGDVGPAAASDMPTPVNVFMQKGTNLKGAMWTATEPFELGITLTTL